MNDVFDWDGARAAYVAGGVSQREVARRFGVPYGTLSRRAAEEGWRAQRERGTARNEGRGEAEGGDVAARLRRKLLLRLERAADDMPEGAVTEMKSQDEGRTMLFKLRDLTAAYKDLAPDAKKGDEVDVEDLGALEELLKE